MDWPSENTSLQNQREVLMKRGTNEVVGGDLFFFFFAAFSASVSDLDLKVKFSFIFSHSC